MERLSQLEGSCFNFVFLCRVHWEFSILQYSFLKLLPVPFKIGQSWWCQRWKANISVWGMCKAFRYQSCEVFCEAGVQKRDSAVGSWQGGGAETGTFRRQSFLLEFRRQHLLFEGHSYLRVGQIEVAHKFPPPGVCSPCSETVPRETSEEVFSNIRLRKGDPHHLVGFYFYTLNIDLFLLTFCISTPLGPHTIIHLHLPLPMGYSSHVQSLHHLHHSFPPTITSGVQPV